MKAILSFLIKWDLYFEQILPPNTPGVYLVLENSCQDPQTFLVQGESVEYLGIGDHHDNEFDKYIQEANFDPITKIPDGTPYGMEFDHDFCPIRIFIYPSQQFYDRYKTMSPFVDAVTIASLMIFSILIFLIYERLVEYRQKIVLNQALRSTAIVTSLFPKNVQDRLMNQANDSNLSTGTTNVNSENISTIADFFPSATGKSIFL
jgi:uncharacterized membrane protein YagU involved in acid resistance